MGQYFFKMSQAEKNDILDKHKSVYDGYVTEYGNTNNEQPLYIQDFANDKNGLTVTNTGNVKHYTNMNINESHTGSDYIGDGPNDLENGTVDLHDTYPSPNEDEYFSLGVFDDDDEWDNENESRYDDRVNYGIDDESRYDDNNDLDDDDDQIDEEWNQDFEFDIDRDLNDDLAGPMDYNGYIEEDELPNFIEDLNESLDMFKRFRKYN